MMKFRDELLTHRFLWIQIILLLLTKFKNICFRFSHVVCTTFFRAVHSYTVFTYQPVAVQLGVEEEGGESRSTARLCFSAAVSDFRWRTSKIDFYKKTIAAALISGREQWTGHVRVCVHSVQ